MDLKGALGRVGLWQFQFDTTPWAEARDRVAEIEALGYGAIWIPEAVGKDPFASATLLLGASDHMAVATGIASIYARDPLTMKSGWNTVSEAFPGRFLLGLGVSHAPMVEGIREHTYLPPVAAMSDYLDRLDASMYFAAEPSIKPARVLAALGPKMLALAAERSAGAHPYNATPEHTRDAREIMGPGAFLAPEQKVVLCTDPSVARETARNAIGMYVGLPNYENSWRRLGFTDDDITDRSDRLVDGLVAWGDEETIARRIQDHHDAGADHVAVQVLPLEHGTRLPMDDFRRLAPALLS